MLLTLTPNPNDICAGRGAGRAGRMRALRDADLPTIPLSGV